MVKPKVDNLGIYNLPRTFGCAGQTKSLWSLLCVPNTPLLGEFNTPFTKYVHHLSLVFTKVGKVKVCDFRNNTILRVLPPSYWRCRALSWLVILLTVTFYTLCPCHLLKHDDMIDRVDMFCILSC
jgi:hypothetical protein